MTTFQKEYSSEELCDVDRDITESFCPDYNPIMKGVPLDEDGFHKGKFKITVEYIDETD